MRSHLGEIFGALKISHRSFDYISIHNKDTSYNYSIDLDAMVYKISQGFETNLNYKHNIRTKQYLLFSKLIELKDRFDKEFEFKK